MRADRLVAILLMLQARGQVTAAEVAEELEVSERTARRDLDALGMAGLPIYSKPGRNGGWQLLGGARTDLSGLTAAEARALFLVAGPSSSATPEVKAALRKLVRALPEPFRADAEAASAAVIVDPTSWYHPATPPRPAPAFLEAAQDTVIRGVQIELGYVARDGAATTRLAHPLGLAAKGQVWYLIADTEGGLRTFRVDRITALIPTDVPVVRPADFDLAEAWRMVVDEMGRRRESVVARGSADPEFVTVLRRVFGARLRLGGARADGRIEFEVGAETERGLVGQLAGFGAGVEIEEPEAFRARLAAIGAELTATYTPVPGTAG